MSDQHLQALTARLRRVVERGQWEETGPCIRLDTARYRTPERWQQEREAVFGPLPLIAARSDELDALRPWLAVDLAGHSLLLSRAPDGQIRAFLNACRHRGMPLLSTGASACKARLSCPYHGWTYDASGQLKGLPHRQAFADLDASAHALVALPCAERHGFIWVQPDPAAPARDIASWLGSLDEDFASFGLADHVCYATGRSQVRANWKLCIDAFLEAYHVRILHRSTVGPYFEDALACSDTVGPHHRSAVARKPLREGQLSPLREAVSFTHFVFPNQIFVFHPDYVSQMSILPRSEREFDWCHRMLIPAALDTAALRPHWDKSFHLIEDGVFQGEDLDAAERIQQGLDTGANEQLSLGQLERLIAAFHQNLDAALGGERFLPQAGARPAASA